MAEVPQRFVEMPETIARDELTELDIAWIKYFQFNDPSDLIALGILQPEQPTLAAAARTHRVLENVWGPRSAKK